MIIGIPLWMLVVNPFFLVLIAIGIVELVLIIKQAILIKENRLNVLKFVDKIESAIQEGGINEAKELCKAESHPFYSMIYRVLEYTQFGRECMYDMFKKNRVEKERKFTRRNHTILIIAIIALLFGFLASIIGITQMATAFAAVKAVDPGEMFPQFIHALGVASLTTIFGILIGIGSGISFAMIKGKVDDILSDIDIGFRKLLIILRKASII
jgi:biopolymer transport protein ExbB